MGTGGGVALLSALFFVPYVHAKVIGRDHGVRWWMFAMGPLLLKCPVPAGAGTASVPDYAVVQDDPADASTTLRRGPDEAAEGGESKLASADASQATHKELEARGENKLHSRLMTKRGPLGWALRTLRDNSVGAGEMYETHNVRALAKRIPAMVVCGALYGLHYDIHAAQTGVAGTPDGIRMQRVYAHAVKYPNEVEHTYSFVQILTACTASFAHGANDIGNSVGPWAVIYSAWSTGNAASAKAPVPVWQLAILAAAISLGLVTYGYNIMKGEYHSRAGRNLGPMYMADRAAQSWATRSRTIPPAEVCRPR